MYKDKSLSSEERAKALLAEMSLEEKIFQLSSDMIRETSGEDARDFRKGHLRSSAHFIHWDFEEKKLHPRTTKDAVKCIHTDVERSIQESPHGIPAIIHDEALHGAQWGMATCFPQPIALASSFDNDLVNQVADVIGKECRAVGVRQVLSPVVNISRDCRWGRTMETFGEDVLLNCNFGVAMCKGFESNGVIATPKHFVDNYGAGGRDSNESYSSERALREIYYKPFERCVKEGGATSIMTSYNSIDGVPCACNGHLLNDILRDEWGFDGFVVSDYSGIEGVFYGHQVTNNVCEAQAHAMKNGHDISLPRCSPETIKDALEKGYLTEETLNESVFRVLKQKFRLGLMDDPYVSIENAEQTVRNDEAKALAYRAAKESLILLKNNGLLPMSSNKIRRIAVFGQAANVLPIGVNYSGPFGGWYAEDAQTPLQALRTYYGDKVEILFGQADEVEQLSKTCDAAIYFTSVVEGEGMDRSDIKLPKTTLKQQRDDGALIVDKKLVEIKENQEELICSIAKYNPNTVVVLLNGSPIDMSGWLGNVGAVVEAWYPGEQGGRAIAELLFGEYSPSGKLPITIPRSVGQLPLYYAHRPSGRGYGYNENDGSPLYPFGYGLSYTKFEVRSSALRIHEGNVSVVGEIKNIGEMDGAEVLQVYISGKNGFISRPVKELKGYKRIEVAKGEIVQFEIPLDKESFYFYDATMRYDMHDSDYTLSLATSVDNIIKNFEIAIRSKVLKE